METKTKKTTVQTKEKKKTKTWEEEKTKKKRKTTGIGKCVRTGQDKKKMKQECVVEVLFIPCT